MLKERRRVSGEHEDANRTDRTDHVLAALSSVAIPRAHIASYVRTVVADLEPPSNATFDQHA
jgi:hypothetical protein